ncbi:hypothetical protein NCAS_0J01870 [Naumovozyma castellii]|uniref:UvrD-like helicase ATP-binding domain-containing protein n=1 Tax=Naumovozyma castellii TaxID=27288 RepID=G0VKX8_NAUCA|nr:hypothetical protein NCAS_0J01870 [Naumovozyma castellii CBS 4309]CCC72166.1 hypothetical protein NCAS_0J01870 [Naumovozyma castellii CBS 4309]
MDPNPALSVIYERAKSYLPIIEKVYAGTNTTIPEANLLGDLLQLLAELPPNFHMFCDPILEPISIFCLTIFSFNEQETVQWLKNKFNPILSQCDKCVLNFARGKCKMLQHFAVQRHVPHEHVSKFHDIVCLWRIEALLPTLRKISTNDNTTVSITPEIDMAMFECLANPHMMRLNKGFKSLFDIIFKFFYSSKRPLLDVDNQSSLHTFLAGIIYCWCEGTKEQMNWSKAYLTLKHRKMETIPLSEFTADLLEEVNIHVLFLQNPNNWTNVIVAQFWSRLIPIFGLFDKDVFMEYFLVPKNIESLKKSFGFPIESIFKLWYNHLGRAYTDKPLDFLLRALNMFVEKFGFEFWSTIEPYTFHSILDIIFDRDTFAIKLIRIQSNEIPENDIETLFSLTGSVTDLLSWTLPFYHALTPSKRIQMVKKVSMAFLRIISTQASLKSIPRACLMNSSTALLRAVLVIKDEERATLYVKDDFETILLTKTDSRALLNDPVIQDIFIYSAAKPNEFYPGLGDSAMSVSISTMMVLAECVNFDILLLCERTFKLYSGKNIGELPFTQTLLDNLTKKVDLRSFHDGPSLAKQLLVALKNINGLLVIPSKSPIVQKHNVYIENFLAQATNLIEKFTDILPTQLEKILADSNASQGFWACIFSSNTKLYQAATNILYETFDVEGRLEGIQAILSNNLTYHIKSVNIVLDQLIKCEFYEPCPRAIRVLMDIISAFADPINGIFSNYNTLKNDTTDEEMTKFWQLSWQFLDTIYRCTLKWASKYEYSELENFTKDTLELSRSLVDSYREFSDVLTNNKRDLFQSVLNTFKNMLYWLRLSDDSLLESCVRLIIKASEIAHEKKIRFEDTLVESIAKYGSKSKKFSNKLSDAQSREILNMAKSFNSDITNKIIAEAEAYHEGKRLGHPVITIPSSPSPSPTPTPTQARVESKADFLQRKAMSSSILGKPKASQSKITSFGTLQRPSMSNLHHQKPTKPVSQMEVARRQLLKNRIVHPPSESVFNTKPTRRVKHEESSSDESGGEDIESARELFAISKEKKGIQTLDINGKAIKKDSKADIAKREEENMRKRLNVDLGPLYDTILQWDYTRRHDYPDAEGIEHYADVKDQFDSAAEYQKIMRPLLLLESWQGLCSARDRQDSSPFSIIVGNRTAVSEFYEVYASMSKNVLQDSGISDSDLIVLAYFPNYKRGDRLTTEDFKRAENTCLAKVRSFKNVKGGNVDITLRIHRNQQFSKFLTLRSEIHAVKVMQMTTIEREYQTLEGLDYYDLVNQIIKAKPSPQMTVPPQEIELVKQNYNLNTSQADAIVNTVAKDGFSLIQGPPGTGKTKTILGIIGYFLSTRKMLPSNAIKTPTNSSTSSMTIDQMLKKQKILICAPSNAAVDEICIRLKDGIFDRNGKLFRPNLVRVGRSDVVNVQIKDLTLEELVDKRLAQKNYEFSNNPELERNFSAAVSKRRTLRAQLDAEEGTPTSKLPTNDIAKIQLEIRELSKQINELGRQRDEMRERNSVNYRNRDLDRRNAQAQILACSDIICSTLSGSAHDVLAGLGIKFDTVIIDEACQCTELSSIIPLRYGGKRCIMVGDPNQLPPTVLSGAASNFKYNQSLFVRMEKNTTPYLLDVQYRMHPEISKFPSAEFYNGRLKDGPNMEEVNMRPWHSTSPFSPYKFFDIVSGKQQQNKKTMSYINMEEIQVALELVDSLFQQFENRIDFTGKIGVISPYREQMQRMRKEFLRYFGGTIMQYVDFNTIDGFQGQEKEIIIISCVRADDTQSSVGFLKDFRRMNVAFTRAKASLWILGHQQSLIKNKLWRDLIIDAKNRNCLTTAYSGFLNKKNTKPQEIPKKSLPSGAEEFDLYNPSLREYLPTNKSSDSAVSLKRVSDDLGSSETSHSSKKPKKDKKHKHSEAKANKGTELKKAKKNRENEVTSDKKVKSKEMGESEKKDKHKKDKKVKKEKKENSNKIRTKEKLSDKISKSKEEKFTSKSSIFKEKSSLNDTTSGTKKKSSIFGGPELTKSSENTGPYIRETKNTTIGRSQKKNRHVSFQDEVTIIPSKTSSRETISMKDFKHLKESTAQNIRSKSPPPRSPVADNDAYDPLTVNPGKLSKKDTASSNELGDTPTNHGGMINADITGSVPNSNAANFNSNPLPQDPKSSNGGKPLPSGPSQGLNMALLPKSPASHKLQEPTSHQTRSIPINAKNFLTDPSEPGSAQIGILREPTVPNVPISSATAVGSSGVDSNKLGSSEISTSAPDATVNLSSDSSIQNPISQPTSDQLTTSVPQMKRSLPTGPASRHPSRRTPTSASLFIPKKKRMHNP